MLSRTLAPGSRPSFSKTLQTLRRDVTTVARDLFGTPLPPAFSREPLARHLLSQPLQRGLTPKSLVVESVVHEATDVVSLHLVDPSGAAVTFEPGQFFTVLTTMANGEVLKRAYSLSMPPRDGESASRARITVKRVADGKVSNHIHNQLESGQTLTVLGPSGNFGVSAEEAADKHLLLIAGGSGITPIRSIVEARLRDSNATATLIFGNRSEDHIVFRNELDSIAREFQGRFAIKHLLESAPLGWNGGVGRLDVSTAEREIAAAINSSLAAGRNTLVLSCGPAKMMENVREALARLNFDSSGLREELFSSPEDRKETVKTTPQPVTFLVRGRTIDAVTGAGQTVLEAGLAAGANMSFSCTMGGCGRCKVKLKKGQVTAEEPNCLTESERSQGYVLACVSRAKEPLVVEVL
ncbi:MAG: iron-sulfur cluster-binding domain-containing protein [Polyangiaceae bacterium]|nr:iron-sulfur cluster-binding domain-containing protein [Polyangiaceae bacterium]